MANKSITLLGNQIPQVSIKSQKSAKHQSIEDEQPPVIIPSLNEILAASESSPPVSSSLDTTTVMDKQGCGYLPTNC